MKKTMVICLATAAAICLSAPAYATQINPPGAGSNLNGISPGTGTNSTLPGSPGNSNAPDYAVPGTRQGNTVPGTLPGNTAPGNTAPGTLPGSNIQGTSPGNTLPGTLPGNTPPNTQPGYTLPGNSAPGSINPNSPYDNGTNQPGTSTNTPQVGGVTNDPESSGQPWKRVPSKQADAPVLDPVTGRTRPLLKAEAVPGTIDVYNVHLHDTLWTISKKYKIKLDAVIDANPELPDPDLIYPGDQIKVPLDPGINEVLDIADSNTDKGDGGTSIRSNIVQGRYSGIAPQETQENAEEKELLELVNNERAKAGLPSVKLSAAVGTVARIKADEMASKKYFNHTSPVYGSPFEMLRAFGITYKTAGENIAKGQKTAKAVIGAWMNSQGHRDNILNPDFKEAGVGYASDGKITYWALIFVGK